MCIDQHIPGHVNGRKCSYGTIHKYTYFHIVFFKVVIPQLGSIKLTGIQYKGIFDRKCTWYNLLDIRNHRNKNSSVKSFSCDS